MSQNDSQPLGPLQRAWVEALRSGKYQQCKGRLNNGAGFCCLGVACDLIDSGAWVESEMTDGAFEYQGEANVLPWMVEQMYAMKSNVGNYSYHASLTELNDDGADFKTIADVIEAYAGDLFHEPK